MVVFNAENIFEDEDDDEYEDAWIACALAFNRARQQSPNKKPSQKDID